MPRDPGTDHDLIDELPALVWVARADGRVEWRNAPAAAFSGLSMETIDADQLASVHPDDKAAVGSFLEDAIAAGPSLRADPRAPTPESKPRHGTHDPATGTPAVPNAPLGLQASPAVARSAERAPAASTSSLLGWTRRSGDGALPHRLRSGHPMPLWWRRSPPGS